MTWGQAAGRPVLRPAHRALAAIVLLAGAGVSAAQEAAPADSCGVPSLAWLESADGGCGPTFESAAAPVELRRAALPSLVEVVYEFERSPDRPPVQDTIDSDEELERSGGGALPEHVRAFIASADTIAIFRLLRDDEAASAGRDQPCPVRVLDLKTCGGRYSIPHQVSLPVPLSADEVVRVKDLLAVRSPFWSPPPDEPLKKFAGFTVGFEFGLSIRGGGQEMFVLLNLVRMGKILCRTADECHPWGHPYRRSTELFCELLERRLGWACREGEW